MTLVGGPVTLPNFLIIGAMKSGTTSLYNYLRQHPRVFMPDYKEPEFFVAEKTWGRGTKWYASLFAGAEDELAIGEASTSYTKYTEFPGVPERIKLVLPEVRLIYILRDPIARIQSMYEHMVLTGQERRPIDAAVLNDARYLGPSMYAANIRLYLAHFPRERLHVMLADNLRADPLGAIGGVTSFLGLPPAASFAPSARADLQTNERRADRRVKTLLRKSPEAYLVYERLPATVRETLRKLTSQASPTRRPQLGAEAEQELRALLRPDAEELRALLGGDFGGWGLLGQ